MTHTTKQKIFIKALSVNKLYTGKRKKTELYKAYEWDLWLKLENLEDFEDTHNQLKLNIEVGLSNPRADLDNTCKAFQDILQKKYHFDDCQIYRLIMKKVDVKKGKEYIKFTLDKI